METSAWELFKRDFKKGEPVIIITEDERFEWGILDYNIEKGTVILSSGQHPAREFHWNQIVFMCHDGFPVRKIFGKYPEDERELIDVPALFRAALAQENLESMERKSEAVHTLLGLPEIDLEGVCPGFTTAQEEMREIVSPFEGLLARIKFGDPFEIDTCRVRLFNAGNVGPQFYLNSAEEVLRMMSKDGAMAQLWQAVNVFEYEIAH